MLAITIAGITSYYGLGRSEDPAFTFRTMVVQAAWPGATLGDIQRTLPSGVVGPGFNGDFGDTYGLIYGFTADGFTHRELRDHIEDIRSRLLQVPDVSKIEILGA